jgi:hypothetical protein
MWPQPVIVAFAGIEVPSLVPVGSVQRMNEQRDGNRDPGPGENAEDTTDPRPFDRTVGLRPKSRLDQVPERFMLLRAE